MSKILCPARTTHTHTHTLTRQMVEDGRGQDLMPRDVDYCQMGTPLTAYRSSDALASICFDQDLKSAEYSTKQFSISSPVR